MSLRMRSDAAGEGSIATQRVYLPPRHPAREAGAEEESRGAAMSAHINAVGEFQSDKYPTCPAGKVPLSTKDPTAQDLLWEYAQRRREVDSEFADDLEVALRSKGYVPKSWVCGTCHATDDRGDICPDCANRMYPSGERAVNTSEDRPPAKEEHD